MKPENCWKHKVLSLFFRHAEAAAGQCLDSGNERYLSSFLLNFLLKVAQVEGDDFRIVHQVAALAGVGVAALSRT